MDDRERIARIFDPTAWQALDEQSSDLNGLYADGRSESLARADAVLAALRDIRKQERDRLAALAISTIPSLMAEMRVTEAGALRNMANWILEQEFE